MTDIATIDIATPFEEVIASLQVDDRYLEALINDLDFNVNNFTHLFDVLGVDTRYEIGVSLGHTLSDYTDWVHFDAETGYSIWKIGVTNYTDNSDNDMFLDGPDDDDKVTLDYRGESDVESQTYFDKVFRYNTNDATPAYTDLTTAVQNEGSSSTFLDDTLDYLYIGFASKFSKITFELDVLGDGIDISSNVEYYNSDATPVWTSVSGLSDGTLNFSQNGTITFTEPVDWAQVAVNSETLYWIRISTADATISTPSVKTITRGSAISDLLLMTGVQIQNDNWAWGYFNNYVYVCIKNTASSATYEGLVYITSTSSAEQLRNYFISNHEYTLNHEKTTYSDAHRFTDEIVIDLTAKLDATANDFIRLLPGNGLTVAELRLDHNDADAVTTELQINRLNSDATPIWEAADLRIEDLYCVNIHATGDIDSGDVGFANGMRFTEVGEDKQDLALLGKDGREILRITAKGNIIFNGTITNS